MLTGRQNLNQASLVDRFHHVSKQIVPACSPLGDAGRNGKRDGNIHKDRRHNFCEEIVSCEHLTDRLRNRALSIRSHKKDSSSKHSGLSFSSLRGSTQPELSKKLYKLIKTENNLISSYEAAGKDRVNIASQLSDWGEATNDDAVSDISDKIGVLLSEIGEQEDLYAHNLDDKRGILKAIRNTEKSVQPSRDNKAKIMDKIAKLKAKEPESAELVTLEQELVRAEAENLVAEAQLTNVVS